MSKFNVGDYIEGLAESADGYHNSYPVTCAGWKGYVIKIRHNKPVDIYVSDRFPNGTYAYWVNSNYFKLIRAAEEPTERKEVDIMSIINENERRILLSEMKGLLDEYDYSYTSRALNKIIDTWAREKATLIEAFKTHPNYLEGKFMIAFDVDYERVINHAASHAFSTWIFDYTAGPAHQFMNNLPEEIMQQKSTEQYLPDNLYYFLVSLHKIAARTISKETADKLNDIAPAVHAHEGQKTSRVINKLCTYLGYNKHPDYNKEFAKYADSLSPLIIKRHTILSLNPLDYLTMSFGNSWASCHTIDKKNKRRMPNSYEGQYSSGTMSYMLDGSSMVLYTVDSSYNGNDYWTQPKINRQMYHWGKEKLVQGRLYPQSCDYEDEEYAPYRNIVQKIISDIFGFPNLWTLTKGSREANSYIITEGTHYPDYQHFSNCTLSRIKGSENDEYFTVGADPICIECGYTHDEGDNINCCREYHGMECADCGCELDEDERIYVNGEYYCRDCVSYCDYCHDYHRQTSYYIPGRGIDVCESCFESYYTTCEYCEENIDRDDARWVESEDGHVCDSCIDEHYFYCDGCNEYYRNEDMHRLDDRELCDYCYEEATEEEEENENEAC
jgi:hypothetical protein